MKLFAMHCAECGKAMTQRDNGSYHLCCTGAGYWYNEPPIAQDYCKPMHKGFWLYTGTKRTPGTKAVPPQ